MKRWAVSAGLLLGSIGAFAANHFDISHLGKLTRVADPEISPDGKSIVIVVSRPNFAQDRYDAELVLVDIANGHQRVLTHERPGISFPRWSPAGDRLAFLSAGANNETQIFGLPTAGGEAFQVTKSPSAVQQFAWRPDGS